MAAKAFLETEMSPDEALKRLRGAAGGIGGVFGDGPVTTETMAAGAALTEKLTNEVNALGRKPTHADIIAIARNNNIDVKRIFGGESLETGTWLFSQDWGAKVEEDYGVPTIERLRAGGPTAIYEDERGRTIILRGGAAQRVIDEGNQERRDRFQKHAVAYLDATRRRGELSELERIGLLGGAGNAEEFERRRAAIDSGNFYTTLELQDGKFRIQVMGETQATERAQLYAAEQMIAAEYESKWGNWNRVKEAVSVAGALPILNTPSGLIGGTMELFGLLGGDRNASLGGAGLEYLAALPLVGIGAKLAKFGKGLHTAEAGLKVASPELRAVINSSLKGLPLSEQRVLVRALQNARAETLEGVAQGWRAAYSELFTERRVFETLMREHRYTDAAGYGYTGDIAHNFKGVDFFHGYTIVGDTIYAQRAISMKTTVMKDVNAWLNTRAVKSNLLNLEKGLRQGIESNRKVLQYTTAEMHIYMPRDQLTDVLRTQWLRELGARHPGIQFQLSSLEDFL